MSELDLELVDDEIKKDAEVVEGIVEDGNALIKIEEIKEITKDVDKSIASQITLAYTPLEVRFNEFDSRYEEVMKEYAEVGDNISEELSKRADRLRLDMRPVRTDADKLRKEQKTNVNTLGKAIDGLGNFFKLKCTERESKLEHIAKVGERKEQERKAKLKRDRIEILSEYGVDPEYSETLNLDEMLDEMWSIFSEKKKKDFEDLKQANIDAEKNRLADEAKKKLGEDRRIKSVKLINFIDEYDNIEFSEITEEEFNTLLKDAETKKADKEKEDEALRVENKRLKEEKDLQDKKDEENRLKKEAFDTEQARRKDCMFDLGLIFDGESFTYEDINFHHTDLLTMTDEEFNTAHEGAIARKKVLIDKKKKAEKIEADRLKKIEDLRVKAEEKRIAIEKAKNLGINRKSKLLDIGVKEDLQKLTDMSNDDWVIFWAEKESAYDLAQMEIKKAKDKEIQDKKDKAEAEKKALVAPDADKIKALMAHFEPLRGTFVSDSARESVTSAYMILKETLKGLE